MVAHLLVHQVRRFPDLEIDALRTDHLRPLDAAFAHAIYDAVIRRWLTMQFLLQLGCDKPWESLDPRARAAMLCGAAQLLFLEKVPQHAAVHESVEWTKRVAPGRAASLVNAVLRRLADLVRRDEAIPAPTGAVREQDSGEGASVLRHAPWSDRRDELPLSNGGTLQLAEPILPRDPLERLSVATSHPIELLRMWAKALSDAPATTPNALRRLALHSLTHAPVILNISHIDPSAPPIPCTTAHIAPGHVVFSGPHDELTRMLKERDDVWAQDPASSLAVERVADLDPEVVIDACAGRGTKTRQLRAVFPRACIIAADADPIRSARLRQVFPTRETLGTTGVDLRPGVRVVEYDRLIDFAGRADLVLLDVPCSNTGVLARRVEAKYRFSERQTEQLTGVQRQIAADALRLLRRPGSGKAPGRILYSTCSLDPRENEHMARWFERWHSFRVVREHRRMPEGVPGEPPERYSDGAYAALLE